MKFQKILTFEKHFKESYPQHLSSVYLIVCPKEGERKKVVGSLVSLLAKDTDFKKCSSVTEVLEHLMSASLFSGKVGALFEGIEGLLKGEIELLARYLLSPNPSGHLILSSASSKNVSDLYRAGKKEMVVLDLSTEKPWEEKDRIKKWAIQLIYAQGKKISHDAVETLFTLLPVDRLLIEQEINKLITYVGDRTEIAKEDIETICSASNEINLFQIAQKIAFGVLDQVPKISDLSDLLPLIAQLKNQCEMGLKMGCLLKKGVTSDEISAAFPRLWPKAVRECMEGTRKKGTSFFKEALLALFDLEMGLKSNLGKPKVLFTQFCGKLR